MTEASKTMTFDLSRVDRLDERRAIAADVVKEKARVALVDALTAPIYVEREAVSDAMWDRHVAEKREIIDRHEVERREAMFPFDERIDAITEAHPIDETMPWPDDLALDDDGFPELCKATGLALFDGDRLLEDDTEGGYVLACVVLPPSEPAQPDTSEVAA